MANKNKNVLNQLTSAGNSSIDIINRLDTATGKFQPSQRKGSIIKAAQGNIFEFPVFISSSIPIDYATATTSLLEQVYASFLQMAISINPVVDADSVKNGLQFAHLMTNTNKYLEYTDMEYAHDACHSVYQEGGYNFEFNMLSIEDSDARRINERLDHQPLSEFSHFFQEADHPNEYFMRRVPMPVLDNNGNLESPYQFEVDANGNTVYVTTDELRRRLGDTIHYDADGNPDGTTYSVWMTYVNDNHFAIPSQSERDTASRAEDYENNRLGAQNIDYGNRAGQPTYTQSIDASRRSAIARADVDARNAARANSRYYNTIDAIDTTARTAGSVANAVNTTANAIYNVGTLGTRMSTEKLKNQELKNKVANLDADRALKRTEVNAKVAAKAPSYVDDGKCAKLNTMKPLLMNVTINMLNKDDSLQPINYIVGVKTHSRVVPASILPEDAKYPLKEMDKIARKVKWRAGELKFLKDLIFRIDEKKQTAADSRDPKRKWYRRLYELAHMKGDAPAAAVAQGKSLFSVFIRDKQGKSKMMNGVIPNASIIMSQADVDNIKNQTEIDLLKGSTARDFCGELFLISLVIVDTAAESIKLMLPEMHNDFEVHSLASVNKQLATLDTAGAKTRDMFKLLN